jgi:hypothetical protein
MLRSKSLLTLCILPLIQLATSSGMAAPEGLSPRALECYEQAVGNSEILMKNKKHGMLSDDQIEKIAVSMCTYSDREGSLRCYQQASAMDDVLTRNKDLVNIFGLEKKYARLCSNSGKNLVNKATGDADAIDCFKQVIADPEVLVSAKTFMEGVEREDLITKLCISSNGLGATTTKKPLRKQTQFSAPLDSIKARLLLIKPL